jgi:hypothetical protein
VQKVCGVDLKCPGELKGRVDVFATTLAIAILRKIFQDRENQWKMIERKAKQWVSTQGFDAERIIAELIGFL